MLSFRVIFHAAITVFRKCAAYKGADEHATLEILPRRRATLHRFPRVRKIHCRLLSSE